MKQTIEHLVHAIHSHFIWIIVGSYFVAALAPDFGVWLHNAKPFAVLSPKMEGATLPLIMLAMVLFNAGLGVKTQELSQLQHKPMLLAGGLFGNFFTPLSFIIVLSFTMKLWHNPEEVQQILVGLALIASMPIAGASTAWTQNTNGNLALCLGLVLLTTLLSPLITPAVLNAVGFVTEGDYSEDLHELASGGIASFLGTWVVLPSVLGIVAQWLIGEQKLSEFKSYTKLVNYIVLLLLNYSNASLSLPKAVANPDLDFLLVMLLITIAMCLAAFVTGFMLSTKLKGDRSATIALMFGLGMNNNGMGLVLASVALADHPEVMLPIIFYNLVQHLIASIVDYTMIQKRVIVI